MWRWLLLGLRVLVLLRCGLLRLCVLQLRLLVVVQRWLVGLRRERAVRVGRGQESCCSCLRLLRRREVGFGVLLVLVNRLLGSSRVRAAVRVRRREQATSARRRGRSEV